MSQIFCPKSFLSHLKLRGRAAAERDTILPSVDGISCSYSCLSVDHDRKIRCYRDTYDQSRRNHV